MVMIAEGCDVADGKATAIADASESNLFYDAALQGVPAFAALEYMAQTMAFAVGARARRNGGEPKIGYILGSRRLETKLPVFRRDTRYLVRAECEFTDEEYASFDCTITDPSGAVVASAALTAFQP